MITHAKRLFMAQTYVAGALAILSFLEKDADTPEALRGRIFRYRVSAEVSSNEMRFTQINKVSLPGKDKLSERVQQEISEIVEGFDASAEVAMLI